tara:strand:+ start:816 stop:1013 length:198 start_codon:yes stop_codon:yes gene_type:complete
MEEEKKLYLVFTDDPHDPHLATVLLSNYIKIHNSEEVGKLGGYQFIIFEDYETAKAIVTHFGGAE